ncbi:MAG: ATP-binding protein [Pantoea sp. Morm]|uniref:AAA family ATPase n=1 Tax=Pantoea TaxID=53335 RepID=UPI001D7D98B9|nr:AAA family ATPase [Pantoea dispersa]MBK4770925.1 ATP-binding protein [Pantoea sp. Morm]WEA05217.1 AAA family ATPase [Pantoea dispersa]
MISNISFNNKEIKLYDEGGLGASIFDIDSISLLIGENGSGKTQFLKAIVNEITSKLGGSFSTGCHISYTTDETLKGKDWGCIYFTPVPFRPDFPRRKSFQDASSLKPNLDVKKIIDYAYILELYGIELNIVAASNNNIKKILYSLLTNLIANYKSSISGSSDTPIFFQRFNRMQQIIDSISAPSNPFTKDLTRLGVDRVDLFNLLEDILQYLSSNHSPSKVFATFIYISSTLKGRDSEKTRRAMNIFLSQFDSERNNIPLADEEQAEIERIERFLSFHEESLNVFSDDDLKLPMSLPKDENVLDRYQVSNFFKLEVNNLSSGQLAVINQVISLSMKLETLKKDKFKKIVILIDEGDAFLHLEWQRLYVYQLNLVLKDFKIRFGFEVIQLILSTHSPLLATDIPSDFICRLDSGKDASVAFASPIHSLLSNSFGAKTIGEFASSRINEVVRNMKSGRTSEKDKYIISCIDNPVLKKEILRLERE